MRIVAGTVLLICLLTAERVIADNRFAGETVTVAVAANFGAPAKALVKKFEIDSAHRVVLSLASSGKLYAQIRNGAPFDIFLSADQSKPQRLVDDMLALADSRYTYAFGTLVLWSADNGLIKSDGGQVPQVLLAQEFRKLALANPRLAPYGYAAVETLESLNLRQGTARQWVQGENINQTFQFIHSGNVELGFIALSQLRGERAPKFGSAWLVPKTLYNPIRQDAVLLRRSRHKVAANMFYQFLASEPAKHIIQSFGYET